VRVHPLAWAVAEVYARQGVAFPNCSVLDVAAGEVPAPGEVVVAPPSAGLRLPRARTAMLTGWALDGRAHGRSDAAFALSDHADFPTLVRYVAATFASRVYTVFGHAEDLARELRRRGIRAEALRESRQLELAL
jgi:putative mRNA 3-end processing factor